MKEQHTSCCSPVKVIPFGCLLASPLTCALNSTSFTFLEFNVSRIACVAMRSIRGGHGAFQLPWLLTPSVLPGTTEISYLYPQPLSLAHEIFRGYTRIKINILALKVRPRHKSGVSNCALGSAILLSPRWFGTAGGYHGNFVSGKNMVLKSRFVPSQNETQQKYW